MRPSLFVLLTCLILCSTFEASPNGTYAQSTFLSESWKKLGQAFESVQEADRRGAPSDEIVQLSAELNTALNYYRNASQLSMERDSTGSDTYANLSITTSANILSKSLDLRNAAENQNTIEQSSAYLIAVVASIVSALLVTEYHRIPNYIRKRKLLKMKLG